MVWKITCLWGVLEESQLSDDSQTILTDQTYLGHRSLYIKLEVKPSSIKEFYRSRGH